MMLWDTNCDSILSFPQWGGGETHCRSTCGTARNRRKRGKMRTGMSRVDSQSAVRNATSLPLPLSLVRWFFRLIFSKLCDEKKKKWKRNLFVYADILFMLNIFHTPWKFSLSVILFIFAVHQCSLVSPLSVPTYLALNKGRKKRNP